MRPLWHGEDKVCKFTGRKEDEMTTKNEHLVKNKSKAIVSSKVRDYGNDPFFVKKANDSKIFLEKHGFPKAFQKRSGGA